MLAAKCALAVRYDALADESSTSMGIDNLTKLEQRLKFLESGKSKRISKGGKSYQGDSWTNQGEVKLLIILLLLVINVFILDGKIVSSPLPPVHSIEPPI